ncbi:MAG: pseudouridine synthase [Parasporobacterium sp.]|nr:pseudouridine synthase [Parasporobacterium sp.]
MTPENNPARLNKYLSDAGICSRREADRLIEAGKITIDGHPAVMGQKVLPGQKVFYEGREVKGDSRLILLAFHKPVGIECTTAADVPDNIIDYIRYPSRIFPIGRLDKNSSGLILMTNKGELSDRILRGSNYHEKEYEVTVDHPVTAEMIRLLKNGVEIELDDGAKKVITRPCFAQATGKRSFRIILTQGLNRQIRRMCEKLGYHVVSLKRIRVMNILLGNLPEGHYRNVTEAEQRRLMKELQEEKLPESGIGEMENEQ